MTFGASPFLWLLLLVPFAMVLLAGAERARRVLAQRFVSERLRGVANPARKMRPALLGVALVLLIVALAGPRVGFVAMPIETHESNRVIVLDVSNSMSAHDVGTSRIEAAKAIAAHLIDAFPGHVALVIFEDRAEVVSPLTTDSDAVNALLATIQPGEIGDPGSDVASGTNAALKLLEADPGQHGDIVLLSDGEDQAGHADTAIGRLRARGVPVTSIVIGSGAGATIPAPGGGELRDDSGNVIHTSAQTEVLGRLARATGGELFVNPFAAHVLDSLAAPTSAGAARRRVVEIPVERFQWPLAAAFLLLVLGSVANRGAE